VLTRDPPLFSKKLKLNSMRRRPPSAASGTIIEAAVTDPIIKSLHKLKIYFKRDMM
jgi:hypothetical protein